MERIRVGGMAMSLDEVNVDIPRPLNEGRADTPLLWGCPGFARVAVVGSASQHRMRGAQVAIKWG